MIIPEESIVSFIKRLFLLVFKHKLALNEQVVHFGLGELGILLLIGPITLLLHFWTLFQLRRSDFLIPINLLLLLSKLSKGPLLFPIQDLLLLGGIVDILYNVHIKFRAQLFDVMIRCVNVGEILIHP